MRFHLRNQFLFFDSILILQNHEASTANFQGLFAMDWRGKCIRDPRMAISMSSTLAFTNAQQISGVLAMLHSVGRSKCSRLRTAGMPCPMRGCDGRRYQLTNNSDSVIRTEDHAMIPADEANRDWSNIPGVAGSLAACPIRMCRQTFRLRGLQQNKRRRVPTSDWTTA